jgi:multidrug efflux pump subunit AcrA (membrane-fusion protein)
MDNTTYTVPKEKEQYAGREPMPPANRKRPGRRKRILKRILFAFIGLTIALAMWFVTYIVFFRPAPVYYLTGEIEVWDGTVEGQPDFIRRTINGFGHLAPERSESVVIAEEGSVLTSNVWHGAQVNEGDVLVVLDSSAVDREVNSLNDQIAAIGEGILSLERNISQAQDKFRADNAQLIAKRNAAMLTAPFAGRLAVEERLTVGEEIFFGRPLARLIDDSSMKLSLFFSYGYEDDIHVGQMCEVSIPSAMATVLGTVTAINKIRRVGEDGSVSFEVEITMANPGALRVGAPATASMRSPSGEDVLPAEPGVLEAIREEALTARSQGILNFHNLRNNHSVAAGELLLELEFVPTEQEAKLEETFLDSIRVLRDSVAEREGQIAGLLEQIDEQYKRLDGLTYRAPISGMVMSGVELWEGVRITSPVEIVIAQLETLTLSGSVFQSDIQRLTVGMPAEVETDVNGERATIPGTLSAIDRTATQTGAGASFPVVISVDNSMGQMMEGFVASFVITLERSETPVVVPFQAVKYYGRDNFVWLKPKDGKAPGNVMALPDGLTPPGFYPVKVSVGINSARYVEITEGLLPEWRGWEVFTQKTDVMPSPRVAYEGEVEYEGEARDAFDDGFQRGWEARENTPPEEPDEPDFGFDGPFGRPDFGFDGPDFGVDPGREIPVEDREMPEGEEWLIPEHGDFEDFDPPDEDSASPERPVTDREVPDTNRDVSEEVIVVRPMPGGGGGGGAVIRPRR